jgi:hypothetical protein
MANHPINLAVRFFLEVAGLFSLGYWGWSQHSGVERWLWAIGAPLIAAALWGTFRVPNDPGKAPVAVPGLVRLLLEMLYFSAAVMAVYASGWVTLSNIFAIIIIIHYLASYDRVLWLLRQE